MKKNIGFIINSENNYKYTLITNNHGKLKIQSRFLNENFSALKNSFFIEYEFLDLKDDLIILNNNIIYKPDNVSILYLCENYTNKLYGTMSLIIFICQYFILEGICTEKILEKLLKLKDQKNNNLFEIKTNLFDTIFFILQNSVDLAEHTEKKLRYYIETKNKTNLILEFNKLFELTTHNQNKKTLSILHNIIDFIINNEI